MEEKTLSPNYLLKPELLRHFNFCGLKILKAYPHDSCTVLENTASISFTILESSPIFNSHLPFLHFISFVIIKRKTFRRHWNLV